MNQDNALKKILETREKGDLPYGFESRLMNQVVLVVKKRKKRAFVLTLCLVSSVSLIMIAGTIYLLKYYLGIHIDMPDNPMKFSHEADSLFGFFFYIAFLALILLGVDTWLRRLVKKSENG